MSHSKITKENGVNIMHQLRKNRRIIALAMVFVMMFAFMAMTASAATTEVQPRGTCPNCTHGYMEEGTIQYKDRVLGSWSDPCPNIGVSHQHYLDRYFYTTICRNCGYTSYYLLAYTREYCPYNGYV